jgi:hypothetical protein
MLKLRLMKTVKLIFFGFVLTLNSHISWGQESPTVEANEANESFVCPDFHHSQKKRKTLRECRRQWKKIYKGPSKNVLEYKLVVYLNGKIYLPPKVNKLPIFDVQEFPHFFVYKHKEKPIYKIDIKRDKKKKSANTGMTSIIPEGHDSFIIDENYGKQKHKLVMFSKKDKKPKEEVFDIIGQEVDYRKYFTALYTTDPSYSETISNIEKNCRWKDIIKKYNKNELPKSIRKAASEVKTFCIGIVDCKNEVKTLDGVLKKGQSLAHCVNKESRDCLNLAPCVHNLSYESELLRDAYDVKTKQFIRD